MHDDAICTKKPGHDAAVQASIVTVQVMSVDRIAADLREQADEMEQDGRTYWPALLREAARRLTDCQVPGRADVPAPLDPGP